MKSQRIEKYGGYVLVGLILSVIVFSIFTMARNSPCATAQIKNTPDAIAQERLSTKARYDVGNIYYVEDLRTGICFAVSTSGFGSDPIATVPCEKIPPKLLLTSLEPE